MKHVSGHISLLAVILICAPASHGQDAKLPSQLDEYYSAYNFAVVLSTPAERAVLARFSSPEAVHDSVGSERLARVYRYMQEVTAHEVEVDPGIFTRPKAPRDAWYRSSDLLKTEQVHERGDGRLVVEVTVYRLDEQDNMHFIQEFEDGDLDGLRERFETATLQTFTRYHEWTERGGQWQKTAAFWQLLSADR